MRTEIGAWGERRAEAYLRDAGMSVIASNYRCKLGEIDLIAMEGGTVVFVEVKTRASISCGLPCESVDAKKRQKILRAAQHYVAVNWHGGLRLCGADFRFDVVEVLALGGKAWLRHIKGAFGEQGEQF